MFFNYCQFRLPLPPHCRSSFSRQLWFSSIVCPSISLVSFDMCASFSIARFQMLQWNWMRNWNWNDTSTLSLVGVCVQYVVRHIRYPSERVLLFQKREVPAMPGGNINICVLTHFKKYVTVYWMSCCRYQVHHHRHFTEITWVATQRAREWIIAAASELFLFIRRELSTGSASAASWQWYLMFSFIFISSVWAMSQHDGARDHPLLVQLQFIDDTSQQQTR